MHWQRGTIAEQRGTIAEQVGPSSVSWKAVDVLLDQADNPIIQLDAFPSEDEMLAETYNGVYAYNLRTRSTVTLAHSR